ncbi:filamin binding [Sparganum proliferum]
MPVAGSGASVKAASNASADQDLAPWENLPQARNSDEFSGQQPSPSDNNVQKHFPQSATHLSNVSKRGEANRPTLIQNVSPLAPLSIPTNQLTISCKACGKYVDIKERMELLNDIFHRFCFKCAICREDLSSTNAIFCNNKWTCEVHSEFKWPARPDQISELLPA